MVETFTINKSQLARSLSLARTTLYYQKIQPAKDEQLKLLIEAVLIEHQYYGHKRVAFALGISHKRARRVMKKFNLKPTRVRQYPPLKEADRNKASVSYPNVTKLLCPRRPNLVWVGDFTYIKYHQRFIYLATTIDRFTREVIGFAVSRWHNSQLVVAALEMAVLTTKTTPSYFHSDQGSEYDSNQYINCLKKLDVQISMSDKAAPWQNGHQESFYSNYKFELDLKNANRFKTAGELIEAIYLQIYYYNQKRIHTALKVPPTVFRQLYEHQLLKRRQCVEKTGT